MNMFKTCRISHLGLCLLAIAGPVSAYAQTQTITGDLVVTGNTDISGNIFSFGSLSSSSVTPGVTMVYSDTPAPYLHFTATRPSASWFWKQNNGQPQLEITGLNQLQLYSMAQQPTITLDPAGFAIIRKDISGGKGATLTIMNGMGGVGATANIELASYDPGAGNQPSARISVIDNNWSGDLVFSTKETGYREAPLWERMRITALGWVGIGTSSPTEKLEVIGNTKISGNLAAGSITINNAPVLTTAGGNGANLTALNASQVTTGTIAAARLPAEAVLLANTQTLANKTLSGAVLTGNTTLGGSTASQQVLINSSGNMGIGTGSPAAKLDVAGNIRSTGNEITLTGAGTDSFSITNVSSANNTEVRLAVGDNALQAGETDRLAIGATDFAAGGSWYPRLTVMASGNVGVGTSAPSAKLDVSGTMNVSGAVQIAGNVTVKNNAVIRVSAAGDIGMGSFTSGSNPAQ